MELLAKATTIQLLLTIYCQLQNLGAIINKIKGGENQLKDFFINYYDVGTDVLLLNRAKKYNICIKLGCFILIILG
jgi:hypothetical protein